MPYAVPKSSTAWLSLPKYVPAIRVSRPAVPRVYFMKLSKSAICSSASISRASISLARSARAKTPASNASLNGVATSCDL